MLVSKIFSLDNMKYDNIFFAILYLISFLLLLYFRENEWNILAILIILLFIVLYMYSDINLTLVLLFTALFCTVENICVYYKLWKYNCKYPMPYVPLWLYLAWALSIIFILRVTKILEKK
jgi:hypothetical protein